VIKSKKAIEEFGKEKNRAFGPTYWKLNGIEMFERLAYFSVRAVVPVYIMQADDPGGLHFTAAMKGTIYAWWFIFQSILPTFTGGFADRYGYKKTLFVSVSMNIIGYLMMANLRTYTGFFAGLTGAKPDQEEFLGGVGDILLGSQHRRRHRPLSGHRHSRGSPHPGFLAHVVYSFRHCDFVEFYYAPDLQGRPLRSFQGRESDSGFCSNHQKHQMVPQQILLNLNALFIILFMVPISWMVRRMRVLGCMIIGMAVATCGILVAGFTGNGWILLAGIIFFSTGEMMTGPKKNEYLGLIAPAGKKALYLGYVNIPVGIGGFVGSKMAGYLYGHYGEKATLALKYMAEHTPFGADKNWDGSIATLEGALGVSRTEAVLKLQEVTGLDPVQVTRLLWETYNPQYHVWIPFAAIGFFAIFALVIFNQMAKKWADMDA